MPNAAYVVSAQSARAIFDMFVDCIEYEELCYQLKPCENGAKCSSTYNVLQGTTATKRAFESVLIGKKELYKTLPATRCQELKSFSFRALPSSRCLPIDGGAGQRPKEPTLWALTLKRPNLESFRIMIKSPYSLQVWCSGAVSFRGQGVPVENPGEAYI